MVKQHRTDEEREAWAPTNLHLVPARLRLADPADVESALVERQGSDGQPEALKLLTKHFLAALAQRAPGNSVEVRVPPYAAVQCIAGVRHTRGTPPAVVETDPETWVALATGELDWWKAVESGRIAASGERTDLSAHLPLTDLPPTYEATR